MSPALPATAHCFFGTETNDEGAPLPDALVVLTYVPDIGPTQHVNTRTGGDGRYELQLSANQPGNVNSTIRASVSEAYAPNTQLVRLADVTEKNILLRRVQTITAGQSATVGFDADSSRCTMPGTRDICESVRVQYPSTFTLQLEVTARGDAGGVVPTLVVDFGSSRVVGEGQITLLIGNDEWPQLYTADRRGLHFDSGWSGAAAVRRDGGLEADMWSDSFMRRRKLLPHVFLCVMVAAACDSSRAPASPSPAATPLPESPRYRVSGMVVDEAGNAPIASATVMLRYTRGTLTTRTNGDGFYEFSFDASEPHREQFWANPPTILGLLIASDSANPGVASRHWMTVQSVPWGTSDIKQNVRLRPVRTLAAGQSMGLSVEPDSSLVWDSVWDPWTFVSFDTLREEFLVSVQTDGVLTIDARSEAGGLATLMCRYVGCPDRRVQGTVSIPVQARWSPLYFAIEVPRGRAPQRYVITTSLK